MSNEQITNTIAGAEKHEIEPPRPLRRPLRPADPYPVTALGGLLSGAANAIQEIAQCPIEICAQSVLAAATLAVQGHADVELPKPTSNFFMTIAGSGERKTTADTEALRFVFKKEEEMRRLHQDELFEWDAENSAWDKERKKIMNDSKASPEMTKDKLIALGAAPAVRIQPLYTCPEPTYEGLCLYLKVGQPSIGVFADEGGQFASGHAMNEDNRIKTATAFCGLWDGKPIKRVRVADGTSVLAGRRISIHLMMQPSVANLMLSDGGLIDQGLMSRFLFCAPESTISEPVCIIVALRCSYIVPSISCYIINRNTPTQIMNTTNLKLSGCMAVFSCPHIPFSSLNIVLPYPHFP